MKQSTILVELQETMGSDASIANAAWTSSYNKDSREIKTKEDIAKLVPKLANDGHGTPFESVVFRFWIRMPIFTDRQHMTHRIASHNGMSGRYRTMPDDFYGIPDDVYTIFKKASKNPFSTYVEEYEDLCYEAFAHYKISLQYLKEAEKERSITNAEFKRAREVLRGVLPQSAMTERTTIMNLRSFANYQFQRNSEHAQPEIKEVARLMLKEVEESGVAPIAIKALKTQGWKI